MTCHFRSVLYAALTCIVGCSDNQTAKTSPISPPVLAIGTSRPLLEVVAGDGQLGAADFGEQRSCTFRLRNNQAQSITLRLVDKSCTCAGVRIPEETIEPGQEATVTLSWSPRTEVLESNTVRLWAEIADAEGKHRRRLEAMGTIEPKVMVAYPRGPLDFGKLTPADLELEQTKLIVEVYSRQQDFASPKCKINVPGLQVTNIEPVGVDRLNTLGARCGYRLTIRPGKELRHGSLQAQLAVQTVNKPYPLIVDIAGSLETTAISFSQDRLQLPPRVSLKTGYRLPTLTLTSRFGNLDRCEVISMTPNLFDVKIQQVNERTWRLEVAIGRDLQKRFSSEEWKHLQDFGFEQGNITLKLDHPDVKSVIIPITGTQVSGE